MADFGSNNVSVINTTTDRIIAQIPLTYGITTVVVDAATGYVYTSNSGYTVYAISSSTNSVAWSASFTAADCPAGCVPEVQTYDASNGDIYVTDLAAGYVSVIHRTSVVATIPVGVAPNGAAYDPTNGEIYVANEGSLNLTVINGTTNTVVGQVTPVWPGPGLAYDPSNREIFVCSNAGQDNQSNSVTVVNGTSNRVVDTISVAAACDGALYDPMDDYIYITNPYRPSYNGYLANVTVIDPDTDQVVLTLPVQSYPVGIAYDSVNHNIYVANLEANTISVLPQIFRLTVHESGLSAGTNWSVDVGGAVMSSTTSTITFPEANGSFHFSIASVANLSANPSSGSITVNGGPQWLNVTFSKGAGSGILGLPGAGGYVLVGGLASVLVIVAVVIYVRRRASIGVIYSNWHAEGTDP